MSCASRTTTGATSVRLAQGVAAGVVLARLGRGRTRRAPLTAAASPVPVSVVIPARDEAARIGPCLDGLLADPDVFEVLVVDDGSTDGTGALARARGARVVEAGEPPSGWVG